MANKRYGHTEEPANDRRPLVLTIVFLIILSATVLFVLRGQLQKHYSIHTISGTSMVPTLTERDQVFIKKNVPVERYDIVAFSVDKEEGKFVKRVIGMPGDRILVSGNRMVLNIGEHSDFEVSNTFQLSSTVADEFQTLTKIPENTYFVIGDHVDVSKDSRTFGFVHQKSIEGTVQFRIPAIRIAKSEEKGNQNDNH